jgi:dihydroorotase
LRASSDFAWGIWNKIRGPKNELGDIRKIMSMYITNKDTQDIIDRALAKQDIKEIKMWPGTEVDAKSEEGLALIGNCLLTYPHSFIH